MPMAGLKRSAAMWVLRRAARHAFDSGSRRWQPGAPADGGATGSPSAGPRYRPTGERPSWARAAGRAPSGVPQRVEDIVRRAWPLVDTPANRDRAARFVERMRTVANSRR
jgi:hypothetical protein